MSSELFRKKPIVIAAIGFTAFVAYGLAHSDNVVDGVPLSFRYGGHPITHETDECYLIPTLEGIMRFTPDDVLITGVKGEIYPCKKEIFDATYEPAEERPYISRRFAYHRPGPDGMSKMTEARAAFTQLEGAIERLAPNGREKALAFTALEEAAFRCNQAIVFGDPESVNVS